MHRLLTTALDRMPEQGYDYTFLIPQRKELIEMYAQYGFRLCAANPDPPVNRVLKTPAQWAILRQDYFDEKGIRLDTEPFFPHEQKGMLRRLHPAAEAIDTLYMGLMLD
jgi:hypothetical protein